VPPESVLHVHQWTKYFSPSLFTVLRASGLPLVLSMHDYFAACPTGLMYRFDKRAPCTLKPLAAQCCIAPCDPKSVLHKGVRVARGFALKAALGDAPLDIVHVSAVGKATIGHFLPQAFRQHVIENPVEMPRMAAAHAANGTHVVYCGRLTSEKGVELVAEAARDAGLPSLFIGDGPAASAIRAIDPAAEITGWLSREAVRSRLERDARVVVAPSLWPETGPLVVAEAQALGIPVIVSERAGASGRVTHQHDGFVVAPERKATADALAIIANPEIAGRMGAAAYAGYWANPPSPEAHAQRLIALYEKALRQGSSDQKLRRPPAIR
jgi:glycosyltransferase involved in cell wall biosynthesis